MRFFTKAVFMLGTIVSLASITGVAATWHYAEKAADNVETGVTVGVNQFVYTPDDMRPEEVTAVQRLADILNRNYKTDKVQDSLEFLLEETIQVYWDKNSKEPFVGSMDNTYKEEINALFGDVLFETGVKFILKNQDLNGDGHNEIAMYSTIDTLDNDTDSYVGTVCVYVTVFTPIVDIYGNVTGYRQVCESVRGYCQEIYYSPSNQEPSFSTDTWRDSVGYTQGWNTYELDEDAKKDYNLYNLEYKPSGSWRAYETKPIGNSLSKVLSDVL